LKISTITVRLPKETTEWLDSLVKKGIYKSRSEAIREFSREFLEETNLDKETGAGGKK